LVIYFIKFLSHCGWRWWRWYAVPRVINSHSCRWNLRLTMFW